MTKSKSCEPETVQIEPQNSVAVVDVAAITVEDDVLQPLSNILREALEIVIPADISSILWMSSQTITMMFVGKVLGSDSMAQYSVGIMMFNIFGISVITGIGSAIDTIASQAYGRNPLSPEIGEVMQRAMIICGCLLVPVTLMFEFVLAPLQTRWFGESIGSGAAEFLRWSPLYMAPILIGATIRRVMLATRAANLVAWANLSAALVSPIANILFIHHGVGVGCVMTLGSIALFNAAAYVLLCLYHPKMLCVRVAAFPSSNVLNLSEMKAFLALGVPAMIAMCAEWWAFDMQEIFTAFVSTDAVAAFGVCMSMLVTLFSIALGIAISCTTLVGNALGANCPIRAKQYVRVLLAVGVVVSSAMGLGLFALRRPVISLFTEDPAVVKIVLDTFPILVLCHIGDTLQFSLQGFFRGVGEPSKAAIAVLVTLWLVGLPAAGMYCLYFGLGTEGVFLGLLSGFLFEIPLLGYFMSKWDWTALAARASQTKETEKIADESKAPCELKKVGADSGASSSEGDGDLSASVEETDALVDYRSASNVER